jgi:hypothetical protein
MRRPNRVICAAESFIGVGGVMDQVVMVNHGDWLSAADAEHGGQFRGDGLIAG